MTPSRRTAIRTGAALGTALAAPWVHAQKTEKVRMSWLPIMQTTAMYVAFQDRMFERAGLEVQAIQFQNPNQIIDSLVANQADLGAPGAAAGITVLAESRYPGTFKVFGLQGGGIKVNRINDALIVKNGSPIKTLADLRGKSLGHLPGIQWRTLSRFMLRANGLDPDKDVRMQEMAVGLQVASVVLVNPCAALIADPFYSGVSVLTTTFIQERPQVARKVVEVLDESTRIANAEFDRVRPYVAKYTAMKGDNLRVIAQPYLRAWTEMTDTDVKSYQALVDVFHKEGVLKERMDVGNVLLNPADLV